MAPRHLLRVVAPIRTISSPVVITRSRITPSLSTPITSRSVSASATQSFPESSPSAPQSSNTISHNDLKQPSLLHNYPYALKTGTVESVGRMDRTARVTLRTRVWDKRVHKYYPKDVSYLVSDPQNSLREGDVIEFSSGAPKSRHVHHVVERIITPFAVPIEERPPVLSREERERERERRWAEKYIRRESRRLGEQVDLAAIAEPLIGAEARELSNAQLIHLIHRGNERVGKVKKLVSERLLETAQEEIETLQAEAETSQQETKKAGKRTEDEVAVQN
ncbi:hypothetical protein N7468_010392 [Penicillium chermesinum]|uniref:Ribosomal protein S17 n=1 Tax=Penicillium chermesinum TaxID=63820 RepID=A0A9W9TCH4_9EURO|nr:uncharacterized protein N7468_010392 [Penicillium chermesinum]KAJ5217384.1 hypothetical protein N7468_010392 [Penicillium chermesinum]KAJ6171004.1 hypothetical protein N7470_000071 [Penicillium chermesinum]